jgi:hypothetical protein
MIKIVSLFLIAMIGLALFGRLRMPGSGGRRAAKPRKCPKCGRYLIGSGPCSCSKPTGKA